MPFNEPTTEYHKSDSGGAYHTTKKPPSAPEWASHLETGDGIWWRHDDVDGVKASEIIGWSTHPPNEGMPVIEPPYEHIDGPEQAESVAIPEESFVPKFEWVDSDA